MITKGFGSDTLITMGMGRRTADIVKRAVINLSSKIKKVLGAVSWLN